MLDVSTGVLSSPVHIQWRCRNLEVKPTPTEAIANPHRQILVAAPSSTSPQARAQRRIGASCGPSSSKLRPCERVLWRGRGGLNPRGAYTAYGFKDRCDQPNLPDAAHRYSPGHVAGVERTVI